MSAKKYQTAGESAARQQSPPAAPADGLPCQTRGEHVRASGATVDTDLLRRVAAGDRQAFGALYLRHRQNLLNFVARRYRLDENAAEDVVSEAFLRFFRRRRDLRITGDIRNYLMGVARSVVADRYRGQPTPETELPADTQSPDPSAHEAMEQAEIASRVAQAVDSLAESHRLALELSQAGLSHKRVAAITGSTEKAARRRAEKARAQLRFSLSRCGLSCVMGTPRQKECPARAKEFFCLKYLYLRALRLTQQDC